jgi:DNA-binding NarL/FixJ family response regulator
MMVRLYKSWSSLPFRRSSAGDEMETFHVLIADDHHLVRRGVRGLLEDRPGLIICGEARTGAEAVAKSAELRPHVVILDINLPDVNGLDAARQIKKASPGTEILVLTMHFSEDLIRAIIDAGILGYFLKSDSGGDLAGAVETVAQHKPFFAACATEVILSKYNVNVENREPEESKQLPEPLTAVEREIVHMLAEGSSSKQIGFHLGITAKKAETQRIRIMRKLNIHSVGELVRYAVRNQIIQP